jgi:hypothetical protein
MNGSHALLISASEEPTDRWMRRLHNQCLWMSEDVPFGFLLNHHLVDQRIINGRLNASWTINQLSSHDHGATDW